MRMNPIALASSCSSASFARTSTRYGLQLSNCRNFSVASSLPQATKPALKQDAHATNEEGEKRQEEGEKGSMSRRLEELTETNLEGGGTSARKAVEEAGFNEDLKQRLLNRIAEDSFRANNQSALSQASMSSAAGQGSREQAAAAPWTGSEAPEDAVLRMLTDAHKPLKRAPKIPTATRPPAKVDTGRSRKPKGAGTRLASARDRSSIYTSLQSEDMTDKERDERRQAFKDRFGAGIRAGGSGMIPITATLKGLSSLANERIEDAIARGQFKNLPRGQKIERDHNMSSPFLDTTEYFMNKIIQKQDIVPPWIEKQQELVTTATRFRAQLRADWRRHAARLIASQGGSLETQIKRAEHCAQAEAIINPPARKKEILNAVAEDGHMSQITLTGVLQTNAGEEGGEETVNIMVREDPMENAGAKSSSQNTSQTSSENLPGSQAPAAGIQTNPRIVGGTVFPFRDPKWEETERAYHTLAVDNLNKMTRSYNLMAPNLAKKPYFSLDRELRSCFGDVAPDLPREIRERANGPKLKVEVINQTSGGVLEHLAGGKAQIYDEKRPQYGFKEFWRDLFASWGAR